MTCVACWHGHGDVSDFGGVAQADVHSGVVGRHVGPGAFDGPCDGYAVDGELEHRAQCRGAVCALRTSRVIQFRCGAVFR